MGRYVILPILVSTMAGCGERSANRQWEATSRAAEESAAATRKSLVEMRGAIEKLTLEMKASEEYRNDGPESTQELHTLAEAQDLINKLGDKPSATKLAETMANVDEWLIVPSEEELFTKFKLEQLGRLRTLVKSEVGAHQQAALKAPTGAGGAKEYAEAGRILVLFPMTDETLVIEEAKQLAARQTEIAGRLEVIRRQRYNKWAVEQIEKALDFYNANVNKWNPLSDNAILIGALVKDLGEVDPMLLEPAVLELYNYVIDRTKGSISEKNKLELAKRLTDPLNQRKTLGDF
jgi:hypothetical protein